MKNTGVPKFLLFFTILVSANLYLFSQDCIVEKDSLKGVYTGDCKKGKANGKGKAVGTDSYEGEFKSGMPDGQGTYTWSNGNTFKGKFEKGLKNGNGIMTYKMPDKADSIVEGFWKKDMYSGRYQDAFKVHFKSKKVTNVNIKYTKSAANEITIRISSTSAGSASFSNPAHSKIAISNLLLKRGGYARLYENVTYSSKSETILYHAWFPIRMQIDMGSEAAEVELFEEGNYIVDITVNQ